MRTRLEGIAGVGDLSLAVEPKALNEARQLMKAVRRSDGDLEACYALGWLYWFRYQALPTGEDQADSGIAVDMFAPCFTIGADDLVPFGNSSLLVRPRICTR